MDLIDVGGIFLYIPLLPALQEQYDSSNFTFLVTVDNSLIL